MALISKASLLMVPSTYEAGKLYNVLPSGNRAPDNKGGAGYDQTRADFDFDRGSNAAATRINSSGLIEKYRENLLLQSNNFGTTWAATSASLTSGQSGYDGSSGAWKLQSTTIYSSLVSQTLTLNGVQTFSVYAKAGTANYLVFYNNAGSIPRAWYDLSNGTIESTLNEIDAKIESVGNGWYRCSMTYNQNISQVNVYVSDANGSFSSAIGSNILIQNAQLETGLVATDYLNSTSVTAKAGVLVDMPRINYDANGENGSLLLEPSRQQLVPYSEWFGASNWVKLGAGAGSVPVISHNYATSPEGVQNATRVQLNLNGGTSSSDQSLFYDDLGAKTGDFTRSVYIKSLTSDVDLYFGGTLTDKKIITATNEWQRFDFKSTLSAATLYATIGLRGTTGSSDSADILVYGFQAEAGSYISSYIPNHGTSGGVTRAADLMYTGPTDLGGGSVGTLMVEIERIAIDTANTGAGVQLLTSSDNEEIRLHFDAPSSQVRWRDANNGYAQIGAVLSVTAGEFFKMCLVSDGTTAKAFGNGAQLGGDYSIVTAFDFDKLSLPQKAYKVKQIYFSNQALTDAECVTLTTL